MVSKTTRDKIDFDGKAVVVTGGAKGIGEGIADGFASLGADVAIADVDHEKADETAGHIAAEHGTDAIAVETDVTTYEDAAEMTETVVEDLGRIDVLVNNAGIGGSKPFLETDPGEWDQWVGVCFFGTLNCTHAALPHMIDRGSGVIINFASDSYKGNDPGLAVYGGAKAANVSFTKTVAKEVGNEGVRLNCVSPGTTETPATEEWIDRYRDQIVESYALSRLGQPEDLADAVVFLSSDAADWITGQVLSVNGGYVKG